MFSASKIKNNRHKISALKNSFIIILIIPFPRLHLCSQNDANHDNHNQHQQPT